MMWKEFEELAGYEVSYDTYKKVIEPMYMALPDNVTKQEFVKMLDKKAFALPTKAETVRKMRKIASFLFENCGIAAFNDEKRELDRIAKEYARRFWGLEWSTDLEAYVYTLDRYAYRGSLMDRGCTFPAALVIGRGSNNYERIELVKGIE